MVDVLVERGMCSLPATVTVAESAGEVCSESLGAEATEPQRDIFNITPGVKHDDRDEKQITLLRFEPLSFETTPGSRIYTQRLARLKLEMGEREQA